MQDTLTIRLLSAVKWQNPNTKAVASSLESACMALASRKLSVLPLVEEAILHNCYASFLLVNRLKGCGCISHQDANQLFQKIKEECYGGLTDDGNLCLLCATALALEDDELIARTFLTLSGEITEPEALCDFAVKLYQQLIFTKNTANLLAAFYLNLIHHYPFEICQSVAYDQGVEIPMSGKLPANLTRLIHELLEAKEFRLIYSILKIFVHVRFEQIDLTAEELIHQICMTDTDQFFRGMLLAETLMLKDTPEPVTALEEWYRLLLENACEDNTHWQDLKYWFRMYYICRHVTLQPETASDFLDAQEQLPADPYYLKKTNAVQQRAMEALCMLDKKCIHKLIHVLGDFNIYHFKTKELQFPYFDPNPAYSNLGALKNLFAIGYTKREIIFIYMNSFLRSCLNISILCSYLFAEGEGLVIHGTFGDVKSYFADYPMTGRLAGNHGRLLLTLNNVSPLQTTYQIHPSWAHMYGPTLLNVCQPGDNIVCTLVTLNLINYQVQVTPCLDRIQPQAETVPSVSGYRKLMDLLKEIEKTGSFSTEQNIAITRVPLNLPFNTRQAIEFHIQAAKCVRALAGSSSECNYFMRMLNSTHGGKLNTCKYVAPTTSFYRFKLNAEQLSTIRECLAGTLESGIDLKEMFFVYINTIYKHCIPFSRIIKHYYPTDNRTVSLSDLFQNQGTTYWFAGHVLAVQEENKPNSSRKYIHVATHSFYPGLRNHEDAFVYLDQDGECEFGYNNECLFTVNAYHPGRNVFYIEKIIHTYDFRLHAPWIVFKSALDKAAISTELTAEQKEDLRLPDIPWEPKRMQYLALSMMNALKLRAKTAQPLGDYLNIIEPNNLWKFSTEPMITEKELGTGACLKITEKILPRLLDNLINNYELYTIFSIYFNTPCRTVFSLSKLLALCAENGIDTTSFSVWLEQYPLVLAENEEGLRTVNFNCSPKLLSSSGPLASGRYFAENFDSETGIIQIKPC